jgi:hypothetical protein
MLDNATTEALLAERSRTHGEFGDNAAVSQALKRVFRAAPRWSELTDRQKEALEMIALKLSRFLTGDPNHADHMRDVAGYAILLVEIDTPDGVKWR